MAKKPSSSQKHTKSASSKEATAPTKPRESAKPKKSTQSAFFKHRSFRRSYREDYERELKTPGLWQHAFTSFKFLCSNWKLFGGLLIVIIILCVLLVGVMSEGTYVRFQALLDNATDGDLGGFAKSSLLLLSAISTGGFVGSLSETSAIFAVVVFLIAWLVTIYLVRHLLAGHQPRLRDGLFNALAPLLSTFVIAIIILLDLVPIGFFIVVLSAAVTTGLLTTPLYALIFLIFSALMILLSLYLLSSSVVALIAVSAPGMYPLAAIHNASELMYGRRIRFCLRLLFGGFIVALAWFIIMVPLIFIDLGLKSAFTWLEGFPFIPACLVFMVCLTFIYITAYLYLYYRRLLDNE